MSLSQKIFQAEMFSNMKIAFLKGRWPQTSVFLGNEGFGSFPLALSVAKMHLCRESKESYCDNCSDCRRVNQLSHPNLVIEFPCYKKLTTADLMKEWRSMILENPFRNATDWMGYLKQATVKPNISASNIRKFTQRLSTSSLEENSKIVIIWQADYLGKSGNIILKTIEEPPENTFIILLASREEDVLGTILSRCQSFRMKTIPEELILNSLKEEYSANNVDLETVSFLAEGSMQEAIKLAGSSLDISAEYFVDFLRTAFKGDPVAIKSRIEEGTKEGKNFLKTSFEFGLKYLAALLFIHFRDTPENIKLSPELKTSAQKLSKIIDLSNLEELQHVIEKVLLGVRRNANMNILLFITAFDFNKLLKRNL